MGSTVIVGDVREQLSNLPNHHFQAVVTSPPYWGLRDYGVDGQLGNEPTPEQYVANLVGVLSTVREKLRDDGTLWLNLGDSYARNGGKGRCGPNASVGSTVSGVQGRNCHVPTGLKEKDLVGIPWTVALALRDAGWYLRSDVIWAKGTSQQKAVLESVEEAMQVHGVDAETALAVLSSLDPYVGNCMPSSVTDRPTTSHEYVFLLTKSPRYYYDIESVREVSAFAHRSRNTPGTRGHQSRSEVGQERDSSGGVGYNPAGRNMRSVWTVPTTPFPGAHFATFPERLVEPMLRAGASLGGCCSACGTPFERSVERGAPDAAQRAACGADATGGYAGTSTKDHAAAGVQDASAVKARVLAGMVERRTIGWSPACYCSGSNNDQTSSVPCRVLDPFGGSGTVGVVAGRLGMDATMIELNPAYAEMARARLADPDGYARRVRAEARARRAAAEQASQEGVTT